MSKITIINFILSNYFKIFILKNLVFSIDGKNKIFWQVNYAIYETIEEARESFITKLQDKLEYGYIIIKIESKIKEEKVDNENDMPNDGLIKPLTNLIWLVSDLK